MNHPRLTHLTAVLVGTAVFFTLLTAAGTKKPPRRCLGRCVLPLWSARGRSAMMRPKLCRQRIFVISMGQVL